MMKRLPLGRGRRMKNRRMDRPLAWALNAANRLPANLGNPNWQSNGCHWRDAAPPPGPKRQLRGTKPNAKEGLDESDGPPEAAAQDTNIHAPSEGARKQL